MESIVINVVQAQAAVAFTFATESGQAPALLGVLVDDVEAKRTIWGLTPSDPHFGHPLDSALSSGHSLPSDPVFKAATHYMAERFSRPLSLVTFGVTPEGFAASVPEGAIGTPQLLSGRHYVVTAFGLSGLGFLEFVAGGNEGAV